MKPLIIAAVVLGIMVLMGPSVMAQKSKQKQTQIFNLAVTSEGFVPAKIEVKANHPVKLNVTRKTDVTCAKEIVIKDFGINQPLPLNKTVSVTFTPTKPGKSRYACSMDMIAGELIIK